MLKQLNSILQKVNKVSKKVSDINALNELAKGNERPLKRKLRNKVKNKIFNILK
jgi:hypothetical protein